MFCMECGQQLPDGAKFCFACGGKINIATDEKEKKPSPAPILQKSLPAPEPEEDEEEYYEEDEEDTEEDASVEEEDEDEFYYEEDEETEEEVSYAASLPNPKTDPYWNDIIPEIEEELHRIPKDIILRGIGIVAGIFAIIAYLIYSLA